jgi:hypothetical protein
MLDATEARRSGLRLGLLMKRIDALYQEIRELERECPAPTLAEFKEMESGTRPYVYEVFFLGLVGEIGVYLDEAVEALWKGYRRYNFSNFGTNLRRDSRLRARTASIIQWRESEPMESSSADKDQDTSREDLLLVRVMC